jgi:hypothetical protein
MFEKKGDAYIDSNKFTEMLRKKTDLNECLRKSLEECFCNVTDVSVRKFRALIDQLKMEIGGGSISFIKEFDVARSLYADSSRFDRKSDNSEL